MGVVCKLMGIVNDNQENEGYYVINSKSHITKYNILMNGCCVQGWCTTKCKWESKFNSLQVSLKSFEDSTLWYPQKHYNRIALCHSGVGGQTSREWLINVFSSFTNVLIFEHF